MEINIKPTQENVVGEVSSEKSSTGISVTTGNISAGVPLGGERYELSELSGDKPKRGRPKKKEGTDIYTGIGEPTSYLESNVPYRESYKDTDEILKKSIAQLDSITADMHQDLEAIRASKTIKNKYNYMADINSAMVSSISAKIAAARELNNTIKNSHELDIKRMKELHLNDTKDDNKDIMDMYAAFISQPISQNMRGPFQHPLGATTIDLTVPNQQLGVAMMGQNPDVIYNNFVNNMTPEQMTMMIEEDPNIDHVIAYDPATGNAEFAIYNKANGQFLQGIPTRDKDMYMPGMNFDFNTMQAHSDDLNETYDIIYMKNPYAAPNQEPIQQSPDTTSPNGEDMSNY